MAPAGPARGPESRQSVWPDLWWETARREGGPSSPREAGVPSGGDKDETETVLATP